MRKLTHSVERNANKQQVRAISVVSNRLGSGVNYSLSGSRFFDFMKVIGRVKDKTTCLYLLEKEQT